MKKIILWIKKNYLVLLPVLLLVIFIASIWDKNFPIGGDNILPLNPQVNIEKSIYVWESWNQGISQWRYTYLLWQLPFYFLSLLSIPLYIIIKIIITSYLVISFVFTYLFFRTLFKETKYDRKDLGIFCGFIFTLNAATLLVLPTTAYLQALPLCAYLVVKYLDTNKIRYAVFFSLALSYAYLRHLPQAKHLVIVCGVLFFVLLLYRYLRRVSLKKIILKLVVLFLFTFLLNAFLLLPFIYESFKPGGTYGLLTQNMVVMNGEADLHYSMLPYISRFFTSSLVNPSTGFNRFFSNPFFSLWTFILWIIAFLPIFLIKEKSGKRIIYLLFLVSSLFIFLAKGANPPFGEIYKFLLFNVPIFKMFRTTADIVIGGTLFFAILVTISTYYITKGRQKLFTIIFLTHVLIFSPIYLGYRLITSEQEGIVKKGFSIPIEYYQMADRFDKIKEDIKILSLPFDDGYSYKDWLYTGQPIMAYLTKKPFIHSYVLGFPGLTDNLVLQRMIPVESCYWTAINNIGYILKEKDSRISDYSLLKFNFSGSVVLENSFFRLEKVNPECFLPHIYVATDIFGFQGENYNIPDASRFLKNKQSAGVVLDNPINRKKNLQIPSLIIEAYPKEISDLSDNVFSFKVFSVLPEKDPLSFWTYVFTVQKEGNYQMAIDDGGVISKEPVFLKSGENTIKIPVLRSKNLIDDDLLIGDKKTTIFSQIIKDWEGDNIYLLFLKYKQSFPVKKTETTSKVSLALYERERYFVGRPPPYELNTTLVSQEMNHQNPGVYEYQAILRTNINTKELSVVLNKLPGDIIVESFKIEKVTPPKVFFTNLKKEAKISPEISFTKINPTKYIVEVKNSTEPYNLVFSESFSPDWKAYVQQGGTSGNLFQEWLQKPIAEDQHFVVNGFANGWNITPGDSRGKTNYRIIIEYWPQRLLYLGGIITLLTLTFCFIKHLFSFQKKQLN